MSVLSFDFSKVELKTGPGIADIPTGVPLYAVIDDIELSTFGDADKFVFQQTIYLDADDDEKTAQFKTFIGQNHGWLLAQYLAAVDQDFRSLSGQGLSADALKTVLVGRPITVTFKESSYKDRKTGEQRTSKQITTVTAGPSVDG